MTTLTTTHLMVGAAAAFALLALRSRSTSTTVPTNAANRAAQQRADAYRGRLWNELRTQPDFWA